MAISTNVVGDISYKGIGRIVKKLLKNGNYKLCAAKFGQPFTIPQHQTVTAKWRRYDNFPQAVAPVSEGVTPPGRKMAATDISATMQQFADWVEISDVLWFTHEDSIPDVAVEKCGIQIGETLEVVTISTLKSDSNVSYANNVASRSLVNSPALPGDLKRIERSLNNNKAEMITSMIKASEKVSTESVDPAFIAMGHTNLKADLEAAEGWTPVKNYADSSNKIHPSEAGAIGVFRFVLTPLFTPWLAAGAASVDYLSNGNIINVPAASDVYPIIITATDAYGVVRLQGFDAVKPHVVMPTASIVDPCAQRGLVSWLTWYTAVVLNSSWLVRYEVCATAMP